MSTFAAFRAAKKELASGFDDLEDWMRGACDAPELEGGSMASGASGSLLDESDLLAADRVLSSRRRGFKFFAAGRCSDCHLFARFACSSLFEADPNRAAYGCSVQTLLRQAASSVTPRSRHKYNLAAGILYFTADERGNLYVNYFIISSHSLEDKSYLRNLNFK